MTTLPGSRVEPVEPVPTPGPRRVVALGTDLARAAWGTASLLRPQTVASVCGAPATRRARAVARVLGARHLVQLGVATALPVRACRTAGAVVDGAHAASCLGLAAASRSWRRAALTDAAVATVFAALGVARRRAIRPEGPPDLLNP
ncbi:hypothetical protein ACL02T_24850 [Pseudonocardia sp. RS010]|uniref:hypothetical protein n=1 Tax=Pseudonocardia sp. RS010 TaxID=3385979 RepID=UPI0039A1F89F